MSLKQGSAAKKPLSSIQKAVPRNPKYQGVKSYVDTGQNAAKFIERNSAANLYNAHDVGRGFKRIRLSTLAKWVETAMAVLCYPDYFDSYESIYDLADAGGYVPPPSATGASLSVAESEASVCGEEKGVPPMFMLGVDIGRSQAGGVASGVAKSVAGAAEGVKAVEEATTQSNRARNQSSEAFKSTQQFPAQFGDAPGTMGQAQYLTTRQRHEKVIQHIHLIPDLKLEIFKSPDDARAPKRISYLAIPTYTKQFVVVDMRSEQADFERQHIFGSVWLPMSQLRKATHRMPPELHHFVKFDESIVVLVGPTGAALEEAGNALIEYGIAYRNVVLLLYGLDELEKEFPNIVVQSVI